MDIIEKIKWIGSCNYTEGRSNNTPIRFIVDHVSEGTMASMDSWFNQKEAKASAHFGIGKDGSIHQYVNTGDTAWANGYVTNTSNPVWIELGALNPNAATISIEHEGHTGEPLTEPQYQSTLELHKYLIEKFGLEYNSDHIIGHYRIDPVNREYCPGRAFPWERLLKDLSDYFDGKEIKNDPVPDKFEGLPNEVKQAILTIEDNWKIVNEYLNK